ncbi:MAG: lysophospholipid acyltransferase family protein [Alistipes sp.]|nr:lysophospholipid acyltransferase family protein [Alistipes sp.]
MCEKKGNNLELNLLQRLGLALLWGFSRAMSVTPRWFRFGLFQPFLTALFRVVGYRRRVIDSNLQSSFPEKSKSEIRKIRNRYYSTLSEVVVDTICLAGVDIRSRGKYIIWENREEHLRAVDGRDWVALASHFGCWEYFPMYAWEFSNARFMSVYHPLSSKVFEAYYRRIRQFAENIDQVPMTQTPRHYISHRSKGYSICLGLVSDQSPSLAADTEWINFLGRPTAFVDGGARLAIKFKIPAYFSHIRRIKPGQYGVTLELIYDGEEDVSPTDIMRRYAERLERMIIKTPELWLWSHKRWKHTPEKQARRFGKSTLE